MTHIIFDTLFAIGIALAIMAGFALIGWLTTRRRNRAGGGE